MDEVDDMDGKWTMDNGRWTMRAMIGIIAIIASICFGQIETHIIDLADPDTYLSDETVYIKRDTSGYLVFADSASGGEVTLAELINSASPGAHSGLTGLSGDDHPQYYNSTRLYSKLGSSNSGTGATYINSLPISGDVGSNATIGAHVADGAIHGKPKGNTLVVAKSGGDYTTIQAAVNAATAGMTVLVYPGTYAEQVSVEKSDISIVGVDREKCIISRASSGVGGDLMTVKIGLNDSADLSGIVLSNLTIKNTAAWGAGTAQEALSVGVTSGSGTHTTEVKIYNCAFYGYQDTIFAYPKSTLTLQGCLIDGGFDILSIWKANVYAYDCDFYQHHTRAAGSIYLTDSTGTYKTVIDGCRFYAIHADSGALHIQDNTPLCYFTNNYMDANHGSRAVYHEDGVSNPTTFIGGNYGLNAVYSSQCKPLKTGTTDIGGDLRVNGIGVDGNSGFSGDVVFYSKSAFEDTIKYDAKDGKLYFGYYDMGLGDYILDTNLYRPSANTLKTDDAFDANGLNNTETKWKDWAAVAACGAAVVWDGNRGRNVGWSPGYGDDGGCYFYNYLLSDDYGQRVYFPIPYEAGTILTRLRVKWCANAQDNGIKVRLVKRDETAYKDAWTVVGAQQSYIDSAGDLNININTYDFADETMQANYSYSIEVESVVDNPVGVRLYSFGIETSKRVY